MPESEVMPRHADPLAWLTRVRPTGFDHGLAVYPPGTVFGPRRCRCWQFIWVVGGRADWEVDGQNWPLPTGAVALARPGHRDLIRWDARQRGRHAWLTFDPGTDLPPDLPWVRSDGTDAVLLPVLRHLRWQLGQADSRPVDAVAVAALRHALAIFGTGGEILSEEVDDQPAVVVRALEWLASLWAEGPLESPSLVRWAGACGVTREHLIRSFTKAFGLSPKTAVRLLRLDRAAQLLARDDLSVQAAAEAAGFASQFHFSRSFSAVYGHPPSVHHDRLAAGVDQTHLHLVKVRLLASQVWRTR